MEATGQTVTLGKRELELELPKSFTTRMEVLVLGRTSITRAYGAALGLCCERIQRAKKISLAGAQHNLAVFGGQVIDALHEDKVLLSEIVTAGKAAYDLITAAELTGKEVEDRLGNSPPDEVTTSS